MIRRLVVLMLAVAVLAPVRPAVAACTTQKNHHCACTVQMTSATCCCTGEEIPAKTQGEAPQVQHENHGLLPASVGTDPTSPAIASECPTWVGRPIGVAPTPLFLLTGAFLS